MKIRFSGLALVVVALLLGCPMPTTPGAGGSGGSLTIQVGNNINTQTLLPPISMTPVSYAVSGSGPGGATFSQTTTGGSVTVNSLAFGSWSIVVNAVNADGTLIGSGQAAASVHTGQTTTVAISVVPLTGNGTLNLTVSWTASQVETPSIQASLTPPTGPTTTLSFSVNGSQATYSSTTIPAGYQTLTVQLMDNNIAVMGAVEVVRIVAGQTTSGTYAFTNVNQPGGSVQVNITPALADPIPVSISGVPATITAGTSVTATASVSDGTTGVVYVWYLNGVSVGTGASFTFGSTLAAGYYRLDVTAYTAARAGSATASFQVTGTSGDLPYDPNILTPIIYTFGVGSNSAFFSLIPSGYTVPPGQTFAGFRIYRTTSFNGDYDSIPFYKDLPATNYNSQTQSQIFQRECLEEGLQTGQAYYYAVSTLTDKGIGRRLGFSFAPQTGPIQTVNEIWGTSDTNIYAVGDGGNLLHYDGNTWTKSTYDFIGQLQCVGGTSSNDVWVGSDTGLMYHFNGAQWNLVRAMPWYQGLVKIFTPAENDVQVSHTGGYFFKWNGIAWDYAYAGVGVIKGIAGSSASNIWAVDSGGGISHWTGSSWSTNPHPIPSPRPLWGCAMSDSVNVYAVGYQGMILHYDGNTWNQESSGTGQDLNAVSYGQTVGLYAVGNQGVIVSKPNPGASWTIVQPLPSVASNLKTVWVSPTGTVWVGGDQAVLTHF